MLKLTSLWPEKFGNIEVQQMSKTLRILEAKENIKGKLSLRQVGGGWLAQESDDLTPEDIKFDVVSEKAPKESELKDAEFAWLCVKHVKSNAIAIAKDNCLLGMGSGQPNRVESLRIAVKKSGADVKGAALASDAFFPFAWKDAVEEACEHGVAVIAEPGGSMRDKDAIECCNKYGFRFCLQTSGILGISYLFPRSQVALITSTMAQCGWRSLLYSLQLWVFVFV
ncbi:hypothetical protein MLD38_008113 [Melastoma candidum]|uniref:Uncharacterized protein n=1 Tax=Melastoma candidum TaxID=119954 RepID=A0ACB9RT82_9MYRT|nr:hypothetical protein MLD38_008113 [Melastoma candidum]